ncbi:uncharacterized protein FPRO_14887 [Fusarium proliferatum ET1]|uniref:hydroxymethylglutaryl-CoA reductase (NADPH) n=1 Tax=Fusarium proliferatum (strain ET1) TaxID=1227346 RepID=A0A1L7WAI2_FUSPR|nr:uncharacterized protein FPRO_14887 [Fusarium proliferatum ET1]CZR49634.1 uncharacterized protein FPRO_14887 [Fusarium proliferatum ET1]
MIREAPLREPATKRVTRSQTLAQRLDQLKRERVNRERREEFLQYKQDEKSKLKAFKAATDSASITVRTDNKNDDSNKGRKRQRSDADRRSAVQPGPPRKKIPPLAGAGTSRDDEQRRKVLRKEWLRVLKFEHTHLLLDMIECLMSRQADRYYLLALQIILIVFPEFDHNAVLETLPAMMRNALEETVEQMWKGGPKKVYLDYPAEGSKDERTECWKQRAELYHGIEMGIERLQVGIFAVCQKGPDGLPPDLYEKVESAEHCNIFTDHFAVNMRRAACVFEMTQLPSREMEFLIFILNEMMRREAETSKKLEEDINRLKQKANESDSKLEDLQKFLDGIGTGTTEAISMQTAADELLEEDEDPPSKSSYTNSVLDGFREKINNYESEIQGLKSARDTSQEELNTVKAQKDSLTTEMEGIRASCESLKDESHQLQARYNAALEEVQTLKGAAAESNQRLVDREVTLKEQLETAQIELEQNQSKSPLQTEDTVIIAGLQDTVNKLTLELAGWDQLYAEIFNEESVTDSTRKPQSILELTQGLKCEIEKLVESDSGLKMQAEKIEQAERTAELESRNAALQARVADLEQQSHKPSPDINMSDASQQQAEDDSNPSLDILASSSKDSVTTTITVDELQKMSKELQDVNSRLETAVQANASLQTKSAELENEAKVLKAKLHASEDEKAKLQPQCKNLRCSGLLEPVPQEKGKETYIEHTGTQTMREAEDARQLKEKITYIEALQSYIKGLEDTAIQEEKNYMLIQKQKDDLASQLLAAKHKACDTKMATAEADRRIAGLQATIKAKQLIIEELESEVTIKGTEHGSIQMEKDMLLSQCDELQRTASSNKKDFEKREKDMKEQIDKLKKEVKDEKETQEKNLKENERILQEKITSINDLERKIKASEDDATREKQDKQLMENEKNELTLRLCEFEKVARANSEKIKKQIQDLQERNLKLKSDVEEQAKEHNQKKEKADKRLKDLTKQVHNLEDEIKNARASLADKDQELQSMKTAHDISEQVTGLQDTIERKESEISTLKEKTTEQAAEQESMRSERENLLSQVADLHQMRNSIKKAHGNSVKLLVVEVARLWNQLHTQAQSCIETKAELSTCRNEHASQLTKLAELSELTQSRNELYNLQKQLEVKDKELARTKKLLNQTEERTANLQDETEKSHSIIENLPLSVASLQSTVDGIQRMVSAQQQSTCNATPNCGSLQPEKGAHNDDSKSFAELRDQIQNLEHFIVERWAKNDMETKVRELQDKIMNLERSGDLLKAEVVIAAARRDDAEAEAAKWVGKHKLLEDRLRKTQVQQVVDAKLKVESEGQESINRIYEVSRADSSIPALMTEISESNKTLSLFFEQYKSDVDQFKSLHRRLETLAAELRDVENRVDNCIGVLGSTSGDSYPGIVDSGTGQLGEVVERRIAKKVSVLIEKVQLKIQNLESALEAKESEVELAALQSEMTVQEAGPMHTSLWKEVPSSPRVGTPKSEPDLSFHTPESIHTPISQHREGIKGSQYGHEDSAFDIYPPLPVRKHTQPVPTQTMDGQLDKGLAIDQPVLMQRPRRSKACKLGVSEENAAVDTEKSLLHLERFRMTVLLHQLSAILPSEEVYASLEILTKSGHIYSWTKIGKHNQDRLNKLAGVESAQVPETFEVQVHNALAGMKVKRQPLFPDASLPIYIHIFKIFADLKQNTYPFFPLLSVYIIRSPSNYPTADMMASCSSTDKSKVLRSLTRIFEDAGALQSDFIDKVRVENCIGFCQIPLAVAGPLQVTGGVTLDTVYAPLATYEGTLVASCSRGCKAFNASGGIHIETLSNSMSRGPVFTFDSPDHAVIFAKDVPALKPIFSQWAAETSAYVRLQAMQPTIIGSKVHVLCSYSCGSAAGQNMVTKATQHACEMLRDSLTDKYSIRGFLIEGQLASDKKPSWGNVKKPRGVETLVWGTISPDVCREVLGCTTDQLYATQQILKEGGIRNGQFGCNVNPINIIAAMFIATGQDPASTAEASWSHLTSELHPKTGALTMSLYLPSLPVGTVGGGTGLPMQREALKMLKCDGEGAEQKQRLAGLIAAFGLALDVSTSAAVTNDTFTASHMRLGRGQERARL